MAALAAASTSPSGSRWRATWRRRMPLSPRRRIRSACSACSKNFRDHPPYVLAKRNSLDAGAQGDPVSLRVKVIGNLRYGWRVPARSWAAARRGGVRRRPPPRRRLPHLLDRHVLPGAVETVFAWIEERRDSRGWCGTALRSSSGGTPRRARPAGRASAAGRPGTGGDGRALEEPPNDEWLELTGTRGVIWVNRCSGEMLAVPPLATDRDGEMRAVHDIDSDWGFQLRERDARLRAGGPGGRSAGAVGGGRWRRVLAGDASAR